MTAEDLLALLPPFEARVHRRAARSIAARLPAGAGLEAAGAAALDERDALASTLEEDTLRFFAASTEERRAGALVVALEAAAGRPATRSDRRAIARGALGLDAVRERGLVRIVRLESEALVAFLAAHARAKREARLPSELAALAERLCAERSWRLARAALGALEEHAREGRSPPARALALTRRLAADPSAPTWTQTAALGLAAAALGEGALPLLANRLTPSGRPDELFVREAAMRLLATQHPREAAPLLSRATKDPSEHVRIELAPLLARVGAFDPLRALADPAEESSPRVRAAAALALASGCPHALEAILLADPEEVPRRAALEAAEPLAVDHGSLRAAIERLAVCAPWPELSLLAAEAAERIHHRCDPSAAEVLAAAQEVTHSIPEGGSGDLPPLEPHALGRALAVLSADDHGLRAERSRSGWRVRRGDRLGRSLWRTLHEVMNPSPDKRQGHLHTVGRVAWGEIAAPPGRLAEVTATKVPGERVLVPRLSDWGRHLPTPDELLARPRGGRRSLYSAFGVSHLEFPGLLRWLAVRPLLWRGYAALCRERWSALTAAELRDRRQYLRSLERLGFRLRFEPHRTQGPAEIIALFEGGEAPRESMPLAALLLPADELVRRFLDPSATTVNHLAAAGFAALGLFYLRLHEARRGLERARSAIPLSIGGWGTRGKSGTERLKAALFQGLGCEVLVKTTGCEAMFIHCVPGIPASETFIYRTYDKATIWEQHDLLLLAERFQVDIFLWECMALNPEYVAILERHWMRDDFCTLTNAYPDHENIQGPAGIDIPRVMTRFIPRGRAVFTAEEQMAPILRDAAEEARAQLIEVRWRDHALLPADVLARFPYEEHPRNIALVLKLAEALGVERSMALKEMADWVVPDLGVLKTFREARWRGRRLVFSNGMSANDRTGFLNNWERCGFDAHRPDDAGEWLVTVVNNRADRVSRSRVFADILVDDAQANAQVLIGTNLAGLNGFIAESLERRLAGLALFHADEASLDPEELAALAALVGERASRALLWVKIGEVGAERLAREARAMAKGLGAEGAPGPEIFEKPVAAGAPTLAASREAVCPLLEPALVSWAAALGPEGADAVRHLLELTARHAAIVSWRSRLAAALQSGAEAVERHVDAFRALLRELFLATLVPLWDESLTGDQVIDAIARACPPGFRVRLMGLQNIKGTGLDFAYRWASFEAAARALDELAGLDGSDAVSAARRIVEAEDCGVLDLSLAEPAIRGAAERARAPFAQELAAVADRALERLREKEAALTGAKAHARTEWARPLERVLDVWDGLWRRRRAESVLQELVDGRISHCGAAGELRKLMDRQKGGWLVKGRG
jgi:poly-gamma-glutamate synthase PgsB/CapB